MAIPFVKYWYYCQECGLKDTHEFPGDTKNAAKQRAIFEGWHIGLRSLCPECKEKLNIKPPKQKNK